MGKLLQFPINRVVRSIPEAPELSEEEQEEIKKEKLKSDLFLKYLALVIESIKSLLKRDFGKPHPMQSITDSFINIATTKEGRKLTDIKYGKILKVKKAEVKEPEKSVSIDFDFDLE